MNRALTLALASAVLFSWSALSRAQAYPAKPIKVIVPIAVGGPPDIAARLVAQKMAEGLGEPLIVENRPGAGGTIGGLVAAKAAPDGYTLLVGSVTSLSLGPVLFPNAGFDPVKLLAPDRRTERRPCRFRPCSRTARPRCRVGSPRSVRRS